MSISARSHPIEGKDVFCFFVFSNSKILCGTSEVLDGNFSIFLLRSHSIITSVPLIQMLQGESHYGERWMEMLEGVSSRKAMSLSVGKKCKGTE